MAEKIKKAFTGSMALFIILLIFCFPVGLIYFFTSREPIANLQQPMMQPPYQPPPYQPPPQ